MSFFKMTTLSLALIVVAFAATNASAASTELVFVIDASGSINAAEFALQMQGYHDAIDSVIPTNGSVAIAGVLFGTNAVTLQGLVDITALNRAAIADVFLNATKAGVSTGSTNIAGGIFAGEALLTGAATRSIIDVSTDGAFNGGSFDPAGPATNPGTALWAITPPQNADVVNALGIGILPNFAAGPNSFNREVTGFATFGAALREKILIETGQIPEPGTMALLGIGILGLGGVAVRRRRRS